MTQSKNQTENRIKEFQEEQSLLLRILHVIPTEEAQAKSLAQISRDLPDIKASGYHHINNTISRRLMRLAEQKIIQSKKMIEYARDYTVYWRDSDQTLTPIELRGIESLKKRKFPFEEEAVTIIQSKVSKTILTEFRFVAEKLFETTPSKNRKFSMALEVAMADFVIYYGLHGAEE